MVVSGGKVDNFKFFTTKTPIRPNKGKEIKKKLIASFDSSIYILNLQSYVF